MAEQTNHPTYESLEGRTLFAAGPQVSSLFADNRGRVDISMSQQLNPATVTTGTVSIFTAGADAKLGTADDVKQNATVNYENGPRRIVVQSTLPADTAYRLVLDANTIANTSGVKLDGEFVSSAARSGDGAPGGNFDVATKTRPATARVARFTTEVGPIDVNLATNTPQTVANFLKYANGGRWDGTFFHRSVTQPNPFVVQGGGFKATGARTQPAEVPEFDPVINEPVNSNVRGTIAMAKIGGDPNSATSQFFFNLADNRQILDDQNGGFTAFGSLANPASYTNMDQLASFQQVNAGNAFGELPVKPGTTPENFSFLSSVLDLDRVAMQMDVVPTVAWKLAAVADYNRDGKSDLFWRNYSTGQNVVWLMNGGTRTSSVALPALANTAWELVGAADMTDDNNVDLIWRNRATGQNTQWLMNGNKISSYKAVPPVNNLSFNLVGVGDLNADNNPDLVWRDGLTGRNAVWFMNNSVVGQMKALPPVPNTDFAIGAVGDVSGDGKADVVFRNTRTGTHSVWVMNGNQVTAFRGLQARPDTSWQIVGAGQFDGSGPLDVVWSNESSKTNEVWTIGPNLAYGTTLGLPASPG